MARLLALLLLSGAALAQERAFIEVTAEKDAYYDGEPIQLTLRFGCDRDFFRDHAVPLFARPMDVPVQVEAQLPGRQANVPAKGPRFGLNDAVATAHASTEKTRDGRPFTVVETLWAYGPSEPGEAVIAAPTLRYSYATEFDEDFVTGRVPRNPRQEVVSGKPLKFRILPLPAEGCPPGFNGAVGRFTVSAAASRTSLAVGETLTLHLRIEGEGTRKDPDLDLPGFHRLGQVRRDLTVDYDLKVLSANVKEIPAIPFAFFDPGPPAGYRVVRTDPIPLEVRGGASPEPPPPPRRSLWPLVAGAVVILAAFAVRMRSRRRAAPPDPHRLRTEQALAAVRAHGDADTFAELLAAYLRCPPAAVIGPDLPRRLAASGMEPALAARAAGALEQLVAVRYGGGLGGTGDFRALLQEIEAAIGGAGSPP